jgi:5-methylthioadenosine/S-adenosylhomocysteine deaminase
LYEDPTVYSPEDVLRQATIDGAIAMGLGEMTGSITPGKRADLIIARTNDLNMGPFIDPVTHIVFSAQSRNVEAVFIDGVCTKRDGQRVDVDVRALMRSVREAVTDPGTRHGEPLH